MHDVITRSAGSCHFGEATEKNYGDRFGKLLGGKGNDRLYGGSGHNHLNGGKGNDIYVIAKGSDNVISDNKGRDTIKMDGDQSDYDMDRDGNDLIIKSHDGKTSVTVKDHYSGSSVEAVRFDDGKVTNFSLHED